MAHQHRLEVVRCEQNRGVVLEVRRRDFVKQIAAYKRCANKTIKGIAYKQSLLRSNIISVFREYEQPYQSGYADSTVLHDERYHDELQQSCRYEGCEPGKFFQRQRRKKYDER